MKILLRLMKKYPRYAILYKTSGRENWLIHDRQFYTKRKVEKVHADLCRTGTFRGRRLAQVAIKDWKDATNNLVNVAWVY